MTKCLSHDIWNGMEHFNFIFRAISLLLSYFKPTSTLLSILLDFAWYHKKCIFQATVTAKKTAETSKAKVAPKPPITGVATEQSSSDANGKEKLAAKTSVQKTAGEGEVGSMVKK